MPQLFTGKWPYFAWIEAVLFFPVAVMMTGKFSMNTGLIVSLPFFMAPFGVVERAFFWVLMTVITAIPFLGLAVAADRLFTIRRGLAFLSCLATFLWTLAAAVLSDKIEGFIPLALDEKWMTFRETALLTVCAASSIIHFKILWIGFRGTDLIVEPKELNVHELRRRSNPSQGDEIRYSEIRNRRTLPSLQIIDHVKKLLRGISDIVMFSTIAGVTFCVALVGGLTYTVYDGRSFTQSEGKSQLSPNPATRDDMTNGGLKVSAPNKLAKAVADVSNDSNKAIASRENNTYDGEASVVRGTDGRYTVDVLVNGIEMTMLYNDDAEFVTLRAEDAVRLGISFKKLDFSMRMTIGKRFVEVAGVTINAMTVGGITYHLVPGVVVRQGTLDLSILGHSFLGRLKAYRVESDRLVLIGSQDYQQKIDPLRK
jgi:aspartyl protease family protein